MSSKSDMRVPKPPKPPEKPLMPYMRYSRKVWEQVKNSNPHLKLWEVGKIIGQMWRELPDDEKMLYMEEYDAEKTQYTELLRQYHTSPAYQAWLLAKERAEKSMEEQDQERRQSILRSRDRGNEVPQGDLRESYILEDNEEDTEDQYTAKHVAAARFQRNHRLMLEVLSDARLPDPGQLITQSRLDMLRLQVEQLRNHKRNLCQEIDGCEARHQAKVQRIREESERFRLEYEKIKAGRPVITESQFADMIVKAKQDIQREEEDRKSRYLAELEMRRRRQQQRQQREAELLESERRRQLLQHHQQQQQQQQQQQLQQAHMRPAHPPVVHGDPNIQFTDRPLERLIVQDKREDASCQPTPSKLPATSTSLVNPVSGKGAASEVVHAGSGAVYPSGICNAFTQPANQNSVSRFPQSGHTQHHYPPPPHYIPSAVPPGNPTSLVHQRSPLPSIQQATPNNAAKANSTTPVNRTKKVASSGSSTSSASSASSTSSKKKKADCDVSKEATSQEMRERPTSSSGESVVDPNQMKSNDLASVTPGHSNEFQQGLSGQPRHVVASQYQPSNVPSNVVSSAQVSGAPVQAPYTYEVSMSNPSNPPPLPGGAYYPHHPPVTMSNPSGYSHARVQFSQHTPYNAMQYHHMPQQASSEQPQPPPPPPPPMYVQHMAQNAAPHVPQQPGTPVGGPNQHPPSHIPQAPPPPHQHNASNWHPAGASPYPAHYGPSRYPVPSGGGHVGYPPMQPPRNFGPNSGGYSSVPHYLVGQQNPQAHPHQNVPPAVPVSLQDGSSGGSQPIPAPPPYQQQQQQQQQQQASSVVGYWPTQHQVPPDYVQSQQPSHYAVAPGSQSESMGGANQQQVLSSVDGVHPCSGISGPPGDGGMGQVQMVPSNQSQGANIYYPGGPVPPYPHGGPNGFYSVPPQHHYAPAPAPPPHQPGGNPWSCYPNPGPPQIPSYPPPQQPQQQQHPQQQQQQQQQPPQHPHQSPQCNVGSSYTTPQMANKPEQSVVGAASGTENSGGGGVCGAGNSNSRPPSNNN